MIKEKQGEISMDFNINTDLYSSTSVLHQEDLLAYGDGEKELLSSTSSLFSDDFEILFKYLLLRCRCKEERDMLRLCRISLAKAYQTTHGL